MIRADHYAQIAKSGVYIPDSYLPDLSQLCSYLFNIWQDINLERPSNGMGVSAISSKFIYDYYEVIFKSEPLSIEIALLKAIDQEFIKAVNDGYSKSAN